MALQIFDRIKERVQVGAGTGNLTLLGAPTGFKTFSSRLSVSDTTYYCIEGPNGAFEIGVGTLLSSTSFGRTTVLRSSNGGAALNIGSGQYFLFISYIADKAVYRNIANEVVVPSEGFRFSDNTTQTTSPTAAIALKADIASPTFTGVPAAPTASGGTNTTQIATTAFVSSAIAAVDFTPYALLPDILPIAGTLLSYGGSRQLAAGGTVTHNGTVTLAKNDGKSFRVMSNATEIFSVGPPSLGGSYYDRTHIRSHQYTYWSFATAGSQLLFGEDDTLPSTASVSISASPSGGVGLGYSAGLTWYNNSSISAGYADLILSRGVTGPTLDVCSAGGIRSRNLANSADAAISCGAIVASDTIKIRNGLTAQYQIINKSHTSDVSQEALMLDAGKQISGKLGLYSYRGTSGGSNYPIQIGMLAADGSTFSGISIATNGFVTITSRLYSLATYTGAVINYQDTRYMIEDAVTGVTLCRLNATSLVQIGGTTNAYVGIKRSGTSLAVRLADDSADAALTCGAITASGNIVIPENGTVSNRADAASCGLKITTGGAKFFRNLYDFATIDYPSYLGLRLVNICGISWSSNDSLSGSQASSIVLAGTNAVAQRNALNAQCFLLQKSYTSDSSQEALMLDAGKQIAGNLGLYSYKGSAGGSNYPLRVGMLAADGSTFSGLSVGTTGVITFSSDAGNSIIGGEVYSGGKTGCLSSELVGGRYNGIVHGYHDLKLSTGNGSYAYRDSVVISGLDQSATFGGEIKHVPPSSVTLATNGQFSIEMTSDTAGNLVYRGSDGTTRRMALTFV